MISYLLILAHLITDFILQPGKLVAWKQKSDLGIFVHVIILAVMSLLLLFPYLNQILVWEFVAILAVTHFIQDKIKIWYEKNYNKAKKFYPFFIDQFVHIAIILAIARYLSRNLHIPEAYPEFWGGIYFNEQLYVYVSLLILFSYALDIVIFQWRLRKNPKLKYKRDYNSISKRIFAFAILYGIFLFFVYFIPYS